MDSIREQILAAFHSKLDELTADVPDLTVFRNRTHRVGEDRLPVLVMLDGGQIPDHDADTTSTISRLMEVDVEGYVQAENDETIGATVNNLLARVQQKIAGNYTMDDLAIDLIEDETLVVLDREGRKPTASFNITFLVRYQTALSNPYSLT